MSAGKNLHSHVTKLGLLVSALAVVVLFQNCGGLETPTETDFLVLSSNYGSASNVVVLPGQTANVTLTLANPHSTDLEIAYTTEDESAIAGTHYTAASGTLVLPAGQLEASAQIATLLTSSSTGLRFRVRFSFLNLDSDSILAIVAFGSNQIGAPPLTPVQLSSNVGLISVGREHTCAVKTGALYCWGRSNEGQLGIGGQSNAGIPMLVVGMDTGVSAVSGGGRFSCAIRNGALFCWGNNQYGQLGTGNSTNFNSPIATVNLSSNVTAVSAGGEHACAIRNGALYCWGRNTYAQVGHNILSSQSQSTPYAVPGFQTNVTAVAAGYRHTCAVRSGALYCWGHNSVGQLGLGNLTSNNERNPTSMTLTPVPGMESNVTLVASNEYATCAVRAGALFCWGYNRYGHLGIGSATTTPTPTPVPGFEAGVGHATISASHACATKASGTYCWGNGSRGELGLGTNTGLTSPSATPIIPGLFLPSEQFIHIAAGGHGAGQTGSSPFGHTCGYTSMNRVFCWGFNSSRQVGDNTTANKNTPVLIAF